MGQRRNQQFSQRLSMLRPYKRSQITKLAIRDMRVETWLLADDPESHVSEFVYDDNNVMSSLFALLNLARTSVAFACRS